MQNELSFVPKILLCGDEAEFVARIGNRPYEIIGHVQLSGEVNTWGGGYEFDFTKDGKILFDDELLDLKAIESMILNGDIDYFIFNDLRLYQSFGKITRAHGFRSYKVITLEDFKSFPLGFFYDVQAEVMLVNHMKTLSLNTVLDVDAYFSQGSLFTLLNNDFTEIDVISNKPILPIRENIYRRVYKNLKEIGFKRYDAVFIAERSPVDFDSMFVLLENFSDTIITFARTNSELERHISGNSKKFSEIRDVKMGSGRWYFITRRKPSEDFCMYVVTHKLTPHEGKLPEGYKIIHAGREGKEDLGYLGDDTSDNISRLNPYINEITALYWMWKNTKHTAIGLSHYRRFFTESGNAKFSYEKILTKDAALKILEHYDIVVVTVHIGWVQEQNIKNACGAELTNLCESIIKKYLLQVQPDYLEAFDYVLNSKSFYKCNMFLTRREVFDAYCKWLFSFLLDATAEILQTNVLEKATDRQRRLMGYFAEIMPTVWLLKNRLRIKEMIMMFITNV